jgi:hypothetical protein
MSQETAQIIIAAGLGVGLLFLFIAVVLYRTIAGATTKERLEATIADRSPGEALKSLLSRGGLVSPQARLTRLGDNRVTLAQGGITVNLEAVRRGSGAQLVAEIDDATYNRRFAMGMGAFVLLLMPAVIAGVAGALWHYVAASDTPSVRSQSLQIMQIVHVLWPPFLIYGLWKGIRRNAINGIANAMTLAETGL